MEVDRLDPVTQQPVLNPDGSTAKDLKEIMVQAFKVVNVFDVSQTDGKPLPTIGVDELSGNVTNYEMFFEALKRACPVPVGFEDIPSGAKGYYHTVDQRIALQEGMSQVQTVKTMIHEMAHQKLHAIDPKDLPPEEPRLTRNAKEVEAEAVAYTVAQHYGIETSDYSFAYTAFLEDLNIRIEDIISWFFKEYLMQEFGVEGFVMNPPSEGSTLVEKNRTLPSELDGVFKQFRMLVTDHIIDRELFEISSNPVSMSELPSMLKNKYAYVNSESLTREQNLLFSDQSMLMYVPKYENEARSFAELLVTHTITISDYPDWEMKDLNWLQERGSIYIDEQKIIRINGRRVALLRDLYDHDVLCCYYYRNKEILEQLIVSGDLRYGNTLFSVPEQEYLNYMLNKSEYSNGMDLRNKYIHSTYPLDEKQQQRDYIHLLKIMMLTVLKINEEYCLGSRTEGEFHENK